MFILSALFFLFPEGIQSTAALWHLPQSKTCTFTYCFYVLFLNVLFYVHVMLFYGSIVKHFGYLLVIVKGYTNKI